MRRWQPKKSVTDKTPDSSYNPFSNKTTPMGKEATSKHIQPYQQPEIIIEIYQGDLCKADDVIAYCKKISEELAGTSKLRLEVKNLRP